MAVPTYTLLHVVAAKDMSHLGLVYRRILPTFWLRLVTTKGFPFAKYRVREALNWMPEADVIGHDWFKLSFEKMEGGNISVTFTNTSRALVMANLGINDTSMSEQNVEVFPDFNEPCVFDAADGQKIYWRMVDLFYTGTRYKELAKALLPYLPTQKRVESAVDWLFGDPSALRGAVKHFLFIDLPFGFFAPAINDDVLQGPDDYARMLGGVQRLFRRVGRAVM